MKPILIEYDPITGARMIPNTNDVVMNQESAQSKKARAAFHSVTKHKNAISARRGNNIKHK